MGSVKTHCIVCREGRTMGTADLDTVFVEGIPHVLFEQEPMGDELEKRVYRVRLDPQFFHPWEGWGEATFTYENPISDPRPSG